MLPSLLILVATTLPAAVDLSPGASFELPMPELGATSDGGTARVGIKLPASYDQERRFPAIVYFGGGGGGADPEKMSRIIGDEPFVVIALPYQNGKLWGSPLSWYRPMMDAAFAAVPNIEQRVVVTAGFSSGGGACGVATFTEGGMEAFCATIPAGLAPDYAQVNHPNFEGFPVLAIIGEKDTAHNRLGQMRDFKNIAERSPLDLTYLEMKGVGHNWDESSWPTVREFLKTKVRDRQCARFLAPLEQAADKEAWSLVLQLAPTVRGLADAGHADAVRAQELVAAANAAAEAAVAEVDADARARELQRFLAEWQGAAAIASIQQRYDALAAAEQPEALAADADDRALKRWVKDMADFAEDWPLSEPATAALASIDQALRARLDSIRAMADGRERQKALVGFAKTGRDHPVGEQALAILKAEAAKQR